MSIIFWGKNRKAFKFKTKETVSVFHNGSNQITILGLAFFLLLIFKRKICKITQHYISNPSEFYRSLVTINKFWCKSKCPLHFGLI